MQSLLPIFLHFSYFAQSYANPHKPNILLITTDQQRFDAIRRVQDELGVYEGKLKIRTPNLDRLSRQGAYIRNTYCQSPICAPSRTVLRTGCTVERTGVQTNPLTDEENHRNPKLFMDKIKQLEGLDQILVEDYGYRSEYYGKWHIPSRLYFRRDGSSLVVEHNDYDYLNNSFFFEDTSWGSMLGRYLEYFRMKGEINQTFASGQQEDSYSEYPYTPIPLDSRFGMPTKTSLDDMDEFDRSENSVIGNFSLPKYYSASYINNDIALRALDRLANQDNPFFITVSYHHPHPPFVVPHEYLSHYWENRKDIFTSPSVGIPLAEGVTSYYSSSEQQNLHDAGYCTNEKIQDWTAVYYALVEEIDTLIGIMLDRLDALGVANHTLVVFTSDHGEMLGSHCRRGKGTFYEESVRVPLFLRFPDVIKANTIVDEPVSLIDVFSTILDYSGASSSDRSDGRSLRALIEGSQINSMYDETAVISEWDYREPIENDSLSRELDRVPNFMVRHGDYKLLIHKKADSRKPDELYNLNADPFELNNLLSRDEANLSDSVIGKAEHLRFLLLDWMNRVEYNAKNDFYTNPLYNANEGTGDYDEIIRRQSWPLSDLWVGSKKIIFGKPFFNESNFVRNEWLFLGRTSEGAFICTFQISGKDASIFRIEHNAIGLTSREAFRLRVELVYDSLLVPERQIDAHILIYSSVGASIKVPLLLDLEKHYSYFQSVISVIPTAYQSQNPSALQSSISLSTAASQDTLQPSPENLGSTPPSMDENKNYEFSPSQTMGDVNQEEASSEPAEQSILLHTGTPENEPSSSPSIHDNIFDSELTSPLPSTYARIDFVADSSANPSLPALLSFGSFLITGCLISLI